MADVAPPEANMDVEKKPFHFSFRLDDGTVIRPGKGDGVEVEVLRPEDAWKAGLLNESHLLRMQALLCEVHAKLPEEGPLKSISLGSKRSMDSVLEVGPLHMLGALSFCVL